MKIAANDLPAAIIRGLMFAGQRTRTSIEQCQDTALVVAVGVRDEIGTVECPSQRRRGMLPIANVRGRTRVQESPHLPHTPSNCAVVEGGSAICVGSIHWNPRSDARAHDLQTAIVRR